MPALKQFSLPLVSPSPRRAWIEISITMSVMPLIESPSPRRAWIEIASPDAFPPLCPHVALPTEGVD